MAHGKRKFRALPVLLTLLLVLAASVSGAADGATAAWEFKAKEGRRQFAAGDYAAALRFFDEALALNPRASSPKTGKGMVLARQGNLQEAERILKEALALNPDPCRTHYELGLIYQQKSDHQKAVNEFKLGIERCRDRMANP